MSADEDRELRELLDETLRRIDQRNRDPNQSLRESLRLLWAPLLAKARERDRLVGQVEHLRQRVCACQTGEVCYLHAEMFDVLKAQLKQAQEERDRIKANLQGVIKTVCDDIAATTGVSVDGPGEAMQRVRELMEAATSKEAQLSAANDRVQELSGHVHILPGEPKR